MLTCS